MPENKDGSRLDSRIMPDGIRYFAVPYHGHERLFSFDTGQYYKHGRYNKRQKARYSRLLAGMNKAIARNERMCFLTLSTQYEKATDKYGNPILVNGHFLPKNQIEYNEKLAKINYAFTKLKQQIEFRWQTQKYQKICREQHLQPYKTYKKRGAKRKKKALYPELFKKCHVKLKYYKVKTSEGGGVLHIIFRKDQDCPMIHKNWIHRTWFKLWGSWNTSIKSVNLYETEGLSRYVISNYMNQQPILRMSYGHQWVYRGFSKAFRRVIESHSNLRRSSHRAKKEGHSTFKQAVRAWNQTIKSRECPKTGYQKRFGTNRQFFTDKYGNLNYTTWGRLKYPKKAYVTEIVKDHYGIEQLKTHIKQPDKFALRYPSYCYDEEGRLIRFPKGKIVISRAIHNPKLEQQKIYMYN